MPPKQPLKKPKKQPQKQPHAARHLTPSATPSAGPVPSWRTPLPDEPRAAYEAASAGLEETLRARIDAYRPQPEPPAWDVIADLVRVGLAGYLLPNAVGFERYGRMVLAHVAACHARGVDLSVTGVWCSAQVEHTLAVGAGEWSLRSRATMAAPLRRISRNLVPAGQPHAPVRNPRHLAVAPYTSDALADLVEYVTTLDSPLWRARASLIVALGAGAGLTDADLRLLEPGDILPGDARVPTRVVVPDTAGRGRTVPLYRDLAALAVAAHDLLLNAQPRLPDQPLPLFSNRLSPSRQVSNRLWDKLAWPGDQRPTSLRLRATWSALLLASGCGLPAYLRAAHVTSYDSWYAAVTHLEDLDDAEYYIQVRGDARRDARRGELLEGHGREARELGEGLVLDGDSPWPSPTVPLRAARSRSSKGGRR